LARARLWQTATDIVNTIFPRAVFLGQCIADPVGESPLAFEVLRDQTLCEVVYRPFQFQKRCQNFFGAHDETLSVVTPSHSSARKAGACRICVIAPHPSDDRHRSGMTRPSF
jgi:hypothetical protein